MSAYNVPASFSNPSTFPTSQDQSLHQGSDPNSPEIFKQNIQLVQEHVSRLGNLARSALSGIENAYHPGSNPTQTESDLASLKQNYEVLLDLMRYTGVGALPLLPLDVSSSPMLPTEQQLMTETSRGVQMLYDKLKRNQESAAVVANLLSGPGK